MYHSGPKFIVSAISLEVLGVGHRENSNLVASCTAPFVTVVNLTCEDFRRWVSN